VASTIKYRYEFGRLENLDHEFAAFYDIKEKFQHVYIIGKTGTGKTVLMENMANYDIAHGASVIFIDPKGKSTKKLYHLAKNKEKLKYLSMDKPMIVNPLRKKGYDIDDIITEFVQILDILVTRTTSNPGSTVLMREIISHALRSFSDEERNLEYLFSFLLYPKVRKDHLNGLTDKKLIRYWTDFDKNNREKVESAKRVASRLAEISQGKMQHMVNGENELNISELVQNGESLLVDTSRMNTNNRIYLTNLIVYAVLSYCEFEQTPRKPLIIYVDEFQTVVSKVFPELLARCRSEKVGFVLAHHDFEEIDRTTLSSILGNVDTQVVFRCGDTEATRFSKIFGVTPQDLMNLEKFMAWVRIGIENTLVTTYPPILDDLLMNEVLLQEISEINIFKKKKKLELEQGGDASTYLKDVWIENV
jgi:type IV secretory pathway VirB4 component